MHDQQRYAYPGRTRVAVYLVLTALDSLVSALVGIPPIRWCARRLATVGRQLYLTARYGPPSESTEVQIVVVDGELIDEESGR
jgi:hypothetical protein